MTCGTCQTNSLPSRDGRLGHPGILHRHHCEVLWPSWSGEEAGKAAAAVAVLVSWLCHACGYLCLLRCGLLGSDADMVVFILGHDLRRECSAQSFKNEETLSRNCARCDVPEPSAASVLAVGLSFDRLVHHYLNWNSTAYILKCVRASTQTRMRFNSKSSSWTTHRRIAMPIR